MITTSRTVTVGNKESIMDTPIILYRGDRDVDVEFTINGNKYMFSHGGNVIYSTQASYGQLVINTPTGENMFSNIEECEDGKVRFTITKEMIDELIEVGFYSFQIRLFDTTQIARVTLPPVYQGIDIRNPIASEDETNIVDGGLVDYSIIRKHEHEELVTFLPDGSYNKTEWVENDLICKNKLNKIEDALYEINANIESVDLSLFNRIMAVDGDVKFHSARIKTLEEKMDEITNENNNMKTIINETQGQYDMLLAKYNDLLTRVTELETMIQDVDNGFIVDSQGYFAIDREDCYVLERDISGYAYALDGLLVDANGCYMILEG